MPLSDVFDELAAKRRSQQRLDQIDDHHILCSVEILGSNKRADTVAVHRERCTQQIGMKTLNRTLALQRRIDQQVLQRMGNVGAYKFRRWLEQGVFSGESWMRAKMPILLQAI